MLIIRVGDAHSVQFIGDFILALIEGDSLSDDPNLTDNSNNKRMDYRLIQSISHDHPDRTILVCCGGNPASPQSTLASINSSQMINNMQNPILLHVKDATLSSSIAIKLGGIVLHSVKLSGLGGELCHIRIDSQTANIDRKSGSSSTIDTILPWRFDFLLIQEFDSTHSNLGAVQHSLELSLLLEWNRINCLGVAEDGDNKDNGTIIRLSPAEVPSPISLTSSPPIDLLHQPSSADEKRTPQKLSIGEAVSGRAAKQETTLKKEISKQEIIGNNTTTSPQESSRPNLIGHTTAKSERWLPPSGQHLSAIRPLLLHQEKMRPIQANSRIPIPFQNGLFEGSFLLMVNTKDMPSYCKKRFEGNKYTFEVQVQGKFLQVPRNGKIFVGGEITKKMELGMITRGIGNSLLQVGRSVNPLLHHSFGDKENFELPHITGPLWSSVDRLMITRSGDTPPLLGESFPEDMSSRAVRKKNPAYSIPLETDVTYSFSLKTSNIDLEKWATANLPFGNGMDLHSFWGDADLRLVLYHIPDDSPNLQLNNNGLPKYHPQAALQYWFALEVQHKSNHSDANLWTQMDSNDFSEASPVRIESLLDENQPKEVSSPTATFAILEEEEDEDDEDEEEEGRLSKSSSTDDDDEEENDDNSNDENLTFFDSVEGPSNLNLIDPVNLPFALFSPTNSNYFPQNTPTFSASKSSGTPISPSDYNYFQAGSPITSSGVQVIDTTSTPTTATTTRIDSRDTKALRSSSRADKTLSFSERLGQVGRLAAPLSTLQDKDSSSLCCFHFDSESYVCAAIEMDDLRSNRAAGSRRTFYAFKLIPSSFPMSSQVENFQTKQAFSDQSDRYVSLRTFKEWEAALPIKKIKNKPAYYKRMNEVQQRRVKLEHSYKSILADQSAIGDAAKSKLDLFLATGTHTQSFLTKETTGVASKKLRGSLDPFILECLVCVKLGNYFWSEEYMGLTRSELIFIKPSKRLGNSKRLNIPLVNILRVTAVEVSLMTIVIPGIFELLVTTFSRQYEILLRGEDTRDEWLRAFENRLQSQSKQKRVSGSGWKADLTQASQDDTSLTQVKATEEHNSTAVLNSGNENTSTPWRITRNFRRNSGGNIHTNPPHTSSGKGSSGGIVSTIRNSIRHTGGNSNNNNSSNNTSANNNNNHSSGHDQPTLLDAATPGGADVEIAGDGNGAIHTSTIGNLDIVARSKGWVLGERIVLNARQYTMVGFLHLFPYIGLAKQKGQDELVESGPNLSDHLQHMESAHSFVAHLLKLALQLSALSLNQEKEENGNHFDDVNDSSSAAFSSSAGSLSMNLETQRMWTHFMDGVSLLQAIDITAVDKYPAVAVCLFINLYHCLLIHAFLVIGPPTTSLKWMSFYRSCSYEAFGDIFSLAELEHCIIRKKMPKPNLNIIAQSAIPNSEYDFFVRKLDYRFVFAINCGSETQFQKIPILSPQKLNQQLDLVMRLNLEKCLKIVDTHTLTLSQFVNMHIRDFETNLEGRSIVHGTGNLTTKQLLTILLPYLRSDLQESLKAILEKDKKANLTVKYIPIDYKCRHLLEMDEIE